MVGAHCDLCAVDVCDGVGVDVNENRDQLWVFDDEFRYPLFECCDICSKYIAVFVGCDIVRCCDHVAFVSGETGSVRQRSFDSVAPLVEEV